MNRRLPWTVMLLLLLLAPAVVTAQEQDDELKELKEEVDALRKELDQLKGESEGEEADDDLAALREAAEEEATEGETEAGEEGGEGGLAEFASKAKNLLNPRITAFGDFVGRWETSAPDGPADDRFSLREAELDFRAEVDPYASAVLILAFEDAVNEDPEEEGYNVDAEEAYLTLDALPWNFSAKFGRFYSDFGRINRLHSHDMPWSFRPLPMIDFLGEEGHVANGMSISWLFPQTEDLTIPLEFTYQLFNGETPEPILAGGQSDDPAHLWRAQWVQDLDYANTLALGSSFLFGYNDADADHETRLFGADFLYRYRPDQFGSIVLQGEYYFLSKENEGDDDQAWGAYGMVQIQPFAGWYEAVGLSPLKDLYLGVRYDYSEYDEGVDGRRHWQVGTYLSYYTTEFLRFRVGWEHQERESTGADGAPDRDRLVFQLTFVFGSHPVEPFWVNK